MCVNRGLYTEHAGKVVTLTPINVPEAGYRLPVASCQLPDARCQKAAAVPRDGFRSIGPGAYLFKVLSRNGRFVAVADVTVMSPRAVIVYTLPATNDTAVRVMAFVADPA